MVDIPSNLSLYSLWRSFYHMEHHTSDISSHLTLYSLWCSFCHMDISHPTFHLICLFTLCGVHSTTCNPHLTLYSLWRSFYHTDTSHPTFHLICLFTLCGVQSPKLIIPYLLESLYIPRIYACMVELANV